MEEKRYTIEQIFEMSNKDIVDLLNQQDKRIKELEEENGYIIFSDGYDENNIAIHEQKFVKYKDKFKELVYENNKLKQENQQFKQSQKQLAIDVLNELKKEFDARKLEYISHLTKTHCYGLRIDRLFEIIDNQIEELKEAKDVKD